MNKMKEKKYKKVDQMNKKEINERLDNIEYELTEYRDIDSYEQNTKYQIKLKIEAEQIIKKLEAEKSELETELYNL